MKRTAFLRAAGAGALGVVFPRAACAQFQTQPLTPTNTIAVVGPFTGPQLRLGEQIANGVREAISYNNQFRSTFDRAFGLRTIDDQNLLAMGLESAQFAVDDATVIAVIGHLSGRITDQALRVYSN